MVQYFQLITNSFLRVGSIQQDIHQKIDQNIVLAYNTEQQRYKKKNEELIFTLDKASFVQRRSCRISKESEKSCSESRRTTIRSSRKLKSQRESSRKQKRRKVEC